MSAVEYQSADDVIIAARQFRVRTVGLGFKVTYNDYERFKKVLHEHGWYGCEKELAAALNL